MTISLGHQLPGASSDLPGSRTEPGRLVPPGDPGPFDGSENQATAPLFGLAPGGVYRARPVTRPAGELLPHRFTLTPAKTEAVCFLWHCPYPDQSPGGGRYPPPRPAESRLSSRACPQEIVANSPSARAVIPPTRPEFDLTGIGSEIQADRPNRFRRVPIQAWIG